jgi:tetratricopeptide (TPR) repeat protein
MGKPKVKDGAELTIETIYKDENNPFVKGHYVKRLKSLAHKFYRDKELKGEPVPFPKKLNLTRFVKAADRQDKYSEITFAKKGYKYIKNLLALDSLVADNKTLIQILWKRDKESQTQQREYLENRFNEIRFRVKGYLWFIENEAALIKSILSDKNPLKDNLFEIRSDEESSTPELLEVSKQPEKSVEARLAGLSTLDRIENIERHGNLPEAELNAHKAILYFEMGNTVLALEFAEKSLKSDPKNSHAWMTLGFLALQGVEEAYLLEVVHKEMGAHIHAISSEEQWHQEMLEDASELKMKNAVKAACLFLKAWSNWPDTTSCYLQNDYQYKMRIVAEFFRYAQHVSFEKDLLIQTINKDFAFLKDFGIYYTSNPKMLLTTVIPVVHSIAPDKAKELAVAYMDAVSRSEPEKDKLNPSDPCSNELLNAAGANLMHLQGLSICLPFEEVELFMLDVDRRFKEVDRISRLRNHSDFYRKNVLASSFENSIQVCEAALNSIPFSKRCSYDKRLLKQWQYLHLSLPVHAAIMTILQKSADAPEIVASLITESITPQLLKTVVGEDYFDIVEDYDNLMDYEYHVDLMGKQFHVLHYGIGFVESDIVDPFSEEHQADFDIPNDLSAFEFVLNHALKATGLNAKQTAKLEALHTHLQELSPYLVQNKPIPVVTPDFAK